MLSVLLSDIISRRILNTFARILIGLWLMISIILLGALSARLYDLLIRPPLIDRVDSWDDLYIKPHWKQSKIYAAWNFEMYGFIQHDTSDMAQDFLKRSETIDFYKIHFSDKVLKILEDIIKTNSVAVLDSLMARFLKVQLSINKGTSNTLFLRYHVSESGFATAPYFILTTSRSSSSFKVKLNFVLVRLYYLIFSKRNMG